MKKSRPQRGAPSVLTDEQPAFPDEHPRRGKLFNDGRKVTDQPQVGGMTPDTDADEPTPKRRRAQR
jgi:hypothetical protein